MHGLVALADFLIGQCDIMENTDTEDKRRKLIYDRIPDVVKDGPALARELKWRVQRELPKVEAEETVTVKAEDGAVKKEKAVRTRRPTSVIPQKGSSRIWNVNLP
jgi:F-box/leucine-rich repeat protein 10/11